MYALEDWHLHHTSPRGKTSLELSQCAHSRVEELAAGGLSSSLPPRLPAASGQLPSPGYESHLHPHLQWLPCPGSSLIPSSSQSSSLVQTWGRAPGVESLRPLPALSVDSTALPQQVGI